MSARILHSFCLIVIQIFFLIGCENSPAKEPEVAGTASVSGKANPEVAGEDWPVFLGSHHYGISTETDLLDSWPTQGPKLVWKRKVGTGYSAPSIRGNRLVVHHRIKDEEIVECLDAQTAKVLWEYTGFKEIKKKKDGEMGVDPKLLEILVCPLTKGALDYDKKKSELISREAGLAYPIRDGIPIMLPDEARKLDD